MKVSSAAKKKPVVVALGGGSSMPVPAHRIGRIAMIRAGRVWVECPGMHDGPHVARVLSSLEPERIREAAAQRAEALLAFDGARFDRPIIVGLLSPEEDDAHPVSSANDAQEVEIDGQRVAIEAEQEITLRCGDASITLRRDGRVIVRGVHVETCAQGTNRIKGGAVQIN